MITDNLFSHSSLATRDWLAGHPRLEQVFIPKGACWLNLQEAWWRIFRRHALAGQTFADPGEIAQVTEVATAQLNSHARPWVRGRPPPPPHDPADAASPTCFEERSTSPRARVFTDLAFALFRVSWQDTGSGVTALAVTALALAYGPLRR